MDDLSYTSSLAALLKKQYTGEQGAPCFDFTKGIKQWHLDQCSRNLTAGRDTPSPAILIQQMLNCLPDDSDAYYVFAQIRTAILPAIKAAERGLYYPGQPTEAERDAALRSRRGLQEYEDHMTAMYSKHFKTVSDVAASRNLLSDGAGTGSSQQQAAVRVQISVGAASASPGLAAAAPVVLDDGGAMYTPNMYVFARAVLMFEIAFGTATQQQENEFKAMKQGSMTADAFAYKLEYLNRTLLHKNFTDSYLVRLFVNGLQDRECAASLQSKLQYMPATQVKLATFRQLVKTYYENKQEGLQVQTESEVAAKMLGKLNIKTPSSGQQSSAC
ncbi:hypothetical protein OEZ86_004653 [Tetradesmus obliquus]|nr:hypothetical protein OEZ86_004653 [Tetradesmus obliquus]